MGLDLESQKWITPYSLNYFWGTILFCHLFPIWFTKIIIIITKQNKNLSRLLSDKVSFLLPSPFSPWMEITACQCLQQLARRQIFQQEHLAGWQAPEAVVLAASTEPGQCWGWEHTAGTVPLSSHVHWGHGTAWAAPVLTLSLPLLPPEQQIPANPSSQHLAFEWVWVALCQCLYVFYSGGPEWFGTSLAPV